MQKMHYHFLIVGVLFLHVLDVISMQPAGQMEATMLVGERVITDTPKFFKRTHIPSLKNLCISTLSKAIDNDNIDELLVPKTIEKCFCLPEELSKKVTTNNFCHKFGHAFVYKPNSDEVNGKRFHYRIMLDELNNHVMVKEQSQIVMFLQSEKPRHCNTKYIGDVLRVYSLTGQEKGLFPEQHCCNYEHSGSFLYKMDRNMITIIKNGTEYMGSYECPINYVSLKRVLRNQQELCLKNIQRSNRHENKKSLFNFQKQLMIYENVDDIQFSSSETICMVKDGSEVAISELSDGIRQPKLVVDGVSGACLNSNGELLFVWFHNESQPPQLIRVKDGKENFSFKDIKGGANVSSALFSCDGRYLIISQPIQHGEHKKHIFDTESGAFCLAVTHLHVDLSLIQKYIVLKKLNKSWFIPTKNLHTMRDPKTGFFPDCRLEELGTFGIAKVFDNFISDFHPSGDFIVTRDEGSKQELVDIKLGKVVITFNNSKNVLFSEPKGNMLCIQDSEGSGHVISSLRNDFTIAEYLLTRFMSEKNISQEGLVQYPHMQKIYDSMDIDKRLFSRS